MRENFGEEMRKREEGIWREAEEKDLERERITGQREERE